MQIFIHGHVLSDFVVYTCHGRDLSQWNMGPFFEGLNSSSTLRFYVGFHRKIDYPRHWNDLRSFFAICGCGVATVISKYSFVYKWFKWTMNYEHHSGFIGTLLTTSCTAGPFWGISCGAHRHQSVSSAELAKPPLVVCLNIKDISFSASYW